MDILRGPLSRQSKSSKRKPVRPETQNQQKNLAFPYIAGVSEKLQRYPMYPFSSIQKLTGHQNTRIYRNTEYNSNKVHVVQCSEEYSEFYFGETKQPLQRRLA